MSTYGQLLVSQQASQAPLNSAFSQKSSVPQPAKAAPLVQAKGLVRVQKPT